MQINHLLVLASDVPAMRDFFVDVIGLDDGPRPPFPFPGHWLYSEGQPLIHLAHNGDDAGRAAYLGGTASGGGGPIDHIAFIGADAGALATRLKRARIDYAVRRVPVENQLQVFVPGPEGVKVEMLFPQTTILQF